MVCLLSSYSFCHNIHRNSLWVLMNFLDNDLRFQLVPVKREPQQTKTISSHSVQLYLYSSLSLVYLIFSSLLSHQKQYDSLLINLILARNRGELQPSRLQYRKFSVNIISLIVLSSLTSSWSMIWNPRDIGMSIVFCWNTKVFYSLSDFFFDFLQYPPCRGRIVRFCGSELFYPCTTLANELIGQLLKGFFAGVCFL